MKRNFPHIGLASVCGWFGITRQAYYKNSWEGIPTTISEELIIQEINKVRKKHPKIGGRKLLKILQHFMKQHSIKKGRDALFALLSANNLLIKKRKRRIQTTNSYHWLRKYPNLIRNCVLTSSNELWVSDITYWKINTGEHLYISFITDAYSHRIVGYHVGETLETVECIQALQMALSALAAERHLSLIHHSDRGLQYCSSSYVKLLQDHSIKISMTENGDPLENAIAERINGIIKDEYLDTYLVNTLKEAKELLAAVVGLYNNERPHMSISNFTPNQIHQSKTEIKTEKLWKSYYQKKSTFVNQEQD